MKNVPKLRFKAFSGEWQAKKLGEVTKTITSGSRDWAQYYADAGSKFIRMTNLSRDGIHLKLDDLKFVDVNSLSADGKRTSLVSGDVLISITAELGKIGWIPSNFGEAFINQHTALVRIKADLANSKLIAYLLSTPKINKKINKLNDAGAKAGLNLPTIKSIDFYFPALQEQTKIADFLTAIDDRISQLAQKCELLEQYKKGVMQKIFSQELRFKDEEGREFPAWEEKRLGDVADIIGGGTPDTSVKEYWGGNIQWFTPTEIKSKFARNSIRTITDKGLKNSAAKKLPVGTLLFSSRATIGDVAIALNECTTNQGFQSFIVSSVNSNEFVYYWVLNNRKLFLEKSSGSTFIEISKKEIEKIPIKRPCIEEQTKIAGFLSAVDEKISQAQAKLEAVKQYKQGLLQQMFV